MKKIVFLVISLLFVYLEPFAFTRENSLNDSFRLGKDELGPLISLAELNSKMSQLPESVKKSIVNDADKVNNISVSTLKAISASSYSDYQTLGTRSSYDDINNDDLTNLKKLLLAEVLQNNGRYISNIVAFCQRFINRKTWVMPAHVSKVEKGDAIDLGAVDISETLSWVVHLFKSKLPKQTVSALVKELDSRIFQNYISKDMTWMGFNKGTQVGNWNPWCNYKITLSLSLLDDNISESTKKAVFEKSKRSILSFVNQYNVDGYNSEGPVYWQQSIPNLFKYLDVLKAGGYSLSIDKSLLQKSLQYIQNMYISGEYFVNFGDASPRVYFFPVDVYMASKGLNDQKMLSFSFFLSQRNNVSTKPTRGTITQAINTIIHYQDLNSKGTPSFKRGIYYSSGQVALARTYENNKGFIFAAKGGNNGDNHSHNDVGSFVLYYQGYPVFIDLGTGTYTKQYFSTGRHNLMATQSQYHNVPQINGTDQRQGSNFVGVNPEYSSNENNMKFSIDLQKAYPKEAMVNSYKRVYSVSYLNPQLTITDRFDSKKSGGKTELFFMCINKPELNGNGEMILSIENKAKIVMNYNKDKFRPVIEEVKLNDNTLRKNWGREVVYRIHLQFIKVSSGINEGVITIKGL
ncbi:heparinase II/III family protein [Sphingobacterium sp. HMA12]|uniref:heparinase II/III domain-containing protein n=1 Tax=Sphingobacterium sp. HMA12 TaxID=2050894 RepID=UPI000CE9EA68|nr:heparinase II/III family protein [Sphingobacterium sp. HMA12]